jgi:hypothetical protein
MIGLVRRRKKTKTRRRGVSKVKRGRRRRHQNNNDLLTTTTFKTIMSELIQNLQREPKTEIQQLEDKVRKVPKTPRPGVNNKLSRDRLMREVLREQTNAPRPPPPVTPALQTPKSSDFFYEPRTKSWKTVKTNRGMTRTMPPTQTPVRTLKRNLLQDIEEGEEEEEHEQGAVGGIPAASPQKKAKGRKGRPGAMRAEVFEIETLLDRVHKDGGDAEIAKVLFPMIHQHVNKHTGRTTGGDDPYAIATFFTNPQTGKVPKGIDTVLEDFARTGSHIQVPDIVVDSEDGSGRGHNISKPYVQHLKAMQHLNVDFKTWYNTIAMMNDSELIEALGLVRRLPSKMKMTTDQESKLHFARSPDALSPRRKKNKHQNTQVWELLRKLRGATTNI